MTHIELNSILAGEGLLPLKLRNQSQSWSLTKDGDRPYFSPEIIRKRGRINILGVFGFFVPAFEKAWDQVIYTLRAKNNIPNFHLYSLYLTNIPKFMDPPLLSSDDQAGQRAWISRIVDYQMSLLPRNLDEFLLFVDHGRVGSIDARRFIGHYVKWMAFLRWLSARGVGFPPSLGNAIPQGHVAPYEDVYDQLEKQEIQF
jgi:hypothetical protein